MTKPTDTLDLRKFVAPEIITGLDARLLISRYLTHFGSKKPLIVTDKNIIGLPWYEDILGALSEIVDDYIVFADVTPNPKDFEAMLGAELFLSNGCDLIIAIGGGSPMDAAKCISIVSTNGGHVLDYEGVDEINLPGPPLICIPSTSGTSADVSQFAIINDTGINIKKAIISKKVVPDLALIDPVPLMTMDNYLTACTGMDALTHAIEAFVSNAQSPLTDLHALAAIKLISEHIRNAVKEGRTIETMYHMMLASMEAGLAFSNASLGAVHAMAHALGGLLDLPHGECNSILLQHVISVNFDAAPDRYGQILAALGEDISGMNAEQVQRNLIAAINTMRQDLGINSTVMVDAIDETLLDSLTGAALNDPCIITNPKELTPDEVKGIYETILQPKE